MHTRLSVRDVMLVLLVVTVWGFAFVPMRWALDSVPPFALASLRFLCAAIPAVFFIRRPTVSWANLAAYGFAIGVFQFGLLFLGMKLGMPAGLSSLVIQTQVFFTIGLAAWWLDDRLNRHSLIGAAIAALGIVVLAWHKLTLGAGTTFVGFLLVIGAALAWAVGNVIAKRAAGAPQGASAPSGGSAAASAASVGVVHRAAGAPQGASAPSGGSAAASAASVGVVHRAAGAPQGASAPSGGSAAASAASVGVVHRAAGTPQGASAPSGGSAAATAASVGVVSPVAGRAEVDMLGLVVWASLIAPLPLALASYAFEGGPAAWDAVVRMTWMPWACVLFMSYFATLFGLATWNAQLHRYPTAVIAPFALLIPVAGLGSGAIFLGEGLAPMQLAGASLVLAGLVWNIFGAQARTWLARSLD